MFLDGIVSKDLLSRKGFTTIYRACDSRKSYILKENSSDTHVEILKHEYMISSSIDLNCILKPLSLEKENNKTVIVYEDILGEPLINHLQKNRFTLKEKLIISIKLAKILIKLHDVGIIHNNYNLDNAIYNIKNMSLKVTDLANSSVFLEEHVAVDNKELIPNIDQAYISPEQTGRALKPVDYRTDLYSLGVALYKLFSGKFPFLDDDTIDMHVNITPEVPLIEGFDNGKFLCTIILKLLEKNPEDRYQSASALRDDLVKCMGGIRIKEVGSTDIKGHINDKYIYPGKEVSKVLEAIRKKDRSFFLLTGKSGSGKTRAINYVQRKLDLRGETYLKINNSEITKLIPYLPITSAISILKEKCLEDFDLLPKEIHEFIGNYGKKRETKYIKNENGIVYLFYNLIKKLFSGKKVIILVDDFEYIDSGSIGVLESIINDTGFKDFIVVCTMDDEKRDSKEYNLFRNRIDNKDLNNILLPFQSLNREEVKTLVSKLLYCSKSRVNELSQFVYRNTGGDPLYINLILNYLNQKGYIYYYQHRGHFQWNLNRIKSSEIPSGFEGLLTSILQGYSESEQIFIQSASFFGYMFDKEIVLKSSNIDRDKLSRAINLLLPDSDDINFNLRFKSKSIHSFLLSNISKEKEKISKKNFARIILNTLKHEDILKIFLVVYFLNEAKAYILKDHEIISLAELNLFCAVHLNKLFKYKDALSYLKNGSFKDDRIKKDNLNFVLKLKRNTLKTAVNCNNFKTIYTMADDIIKYDKDCNRSVDDLIYSVISKNGVSETDGTLNIKSFDLPEKKLSIKDLSNEIVVKALKKFSGNKTRAAEYLGISRQALYRKLEKIDSDY
jgi:tRNA A-37 threonylcarbamoyl transferase component Bud32